MIRLLYNLLFPLGLLFFLPGYFLKMRRRGGYRENFGQRFGVYSEEVRARLGGASAHLDARGQRGRGRDRAQVVG